MVIHLNKRMLCEELGKIILKQIQHNILQIFLHERRYSFTFHCKSINKEKKTLKANNKSLKIICILYYEFEWNANLSMSIHI